jgi:double-stranded uracil-DNA glycosylase
MPPGRNPRERSVSHTSLVLGTLCAVVRISSFAPIETASARILILGSIPGERSLQAGQYYAHPQNAFWGILGQFCGFESGMPYPERVHRLCLAGIAVWDVLQTCERAGSLDTSILPASETPNDLLAFLDGHVALRGILCNGSKAFTALQRFAKGALAARSPAIEVLRLPSTSPANAGIPRAAKAKAWQETLGRLLRP